MVLSRLIRLSSKNVFTNLAAEERLFQRTTGNSLLFYTNRTSVILGRTQNPFNECDVAYAATHGIPIARRRSGGGTVVHDEGNLNFCFMRPRTEHEPLKNAKLVATVLRNEFGIKASVNERADILVDGKKVSGAAYRISRDRAYHHGTLLIDADLERLSRLLKSPHTKDIEAMGTKSLRVSVTNLGDHYSGTLLASDVMEAITEYFARRDARLQALSVTQVELDCGGVQVERGVLSSREWVYGQTPRFTFDLFHNGAVLRFHMAKGTIINNITIQSIVAGTDVNEHDLEALKTFLVGKAFDGPIMADAVDVHQEVFSEGLAEVLRREVPKRFWHQDAEISVE